MKRKYFKIGIHLIAVHRDTNTIYLCGYNDGDLELKVIHSRNEIENLERYLYKKDGSCEEEITEKEFQKVFSKVLAKIQSQTPYA